MQTVILAVCIFVVLSILFENFSIIAKNELDRLFPYLLCNKSLKAENQLKWVGLISNIKAQVEEKIYTEIVYVKNKYD